MSVTGCTRFPKSLCTWATARPRPPFPPSCRAASWVACSGSSTAGVVVREGRYHGVKSTDGLVELGNWGVPLNVTVWVGCMLWWYYGHTLANRCWQLEPAFAHSHPPQRTCNCCRVMPLPLRVSRQSLMLRAKEAACPSADVSFWVREASLSSSLRSSAGHGCNQGRPLGDAVGPQSKQAALDLAQSRRSGADVALSSGLPASLLSLPAAERSDPSCSEALADIPPPLAKEHWLAQRLEQRHATCTVSAHLPAPPPRRPAAAAAAPL